MKPSDFFAKRQPWGFMRPLLVLLIFSILTIIAHGENIKLSENLFIGQKVFIDKGCVSCHSIFGIGGKIGRDLGKTLNQFGPAGIVAMMWNHSQEMSKAMQPNHEPIFTKQEMIDLIAFIYFLDYLDEPGNPEHGKKVFKQKKCLTCHNLNMKNKKTKAFLDTVSQYANPLSLAQDIWNHTIQPSDLPSAQDMKKLKFKGSEMADLFAYLKQESSLASGKIIFMNPGNPGIGKKLFTTKGCVNCHEMSNGRKSSAPDLKKIDFHLGATRLVSRLWLHEPSTLKKMTHTKNSKPVFRNNELADLVSYLYFLNFYELKGFYETGKNLFISKNCIKCHSINGIGGNVAIDLGKSEHTGNYINTATAMWNHNRKMRILMQKIGIAMPRFNEQEMKDLLTYLQSERNKHEHKN